MGAVGGQVDDGQAETLIAVAEEGSESDFFAIESSAQHAHPKQYSKRRAAEEATGSRMM